MLTVYNLCCWSCVLGSFDWEAELITASHPFTHRPDVQHSEHSYGDTSVPGGWIQCRASDSSGFEWGK